MRSLGLCLSWTEELVGHPSRGEDLSGEPRLGFSDFECEDWASDTQVMDAALLRAMAACECEQRALCLKPNHHSECLHENVAPGPLT